MKTRYRQWAAAWVIGGLACGYAPGQAAPAPVAAENPESVAIAERRAGGIMESLKLADAAQAARVDQHIRNFVITLKNLHEGASAPKGDEKAAALAKARETLYAGMDSEKLNDDQKLVIKNGLCANHYKINYDAFLFLVPDLKAEEKQHVHDLLVDAFDEAIVLNTGDAKGKVFEKRRGRVNIYLSKQGYDLKELSKVRNEKLRQAKEQAAPATKPAN